jgi:Mg2+ and Co2+ transporter CorA
LALAEQGTVIRRFHEEMVSRARVLFDQLLEAFDTWIRDALQPLAEQIEAHKVIMERRLDNLQRLGRSKDDMQRRIADTHADYVELARQLTALRNIQSALREDPAGEQHRQRPQPVAKQA